MNRRDQPSTPFSCYRIDPGYLLCAPTSQTSSLEAEYMQDYRNRDLVERFELLPDDHDEDSIFSESSSEKDSVGSSANNKAETPVHNGLPVSLFMPSLQARGGPNVYSASHQKVDRKTLEEEMSSPSKKVTSDRQDPSFPQDLSILQPFPRPNAVSAFDQVNSLHLNHGASAFERSRSDQAQIFETFSRQPTMPYSNTSPKMCRPSYIEQSPASNPPSDLESMPSRESVSQFSQSSFDSEVKYHNTPPKPRAASSNSTAHTVETSTGDLSSKHSSDSSEKSQGESKGSHEYKFTHQAVEESPTTAIYSLIDNSIKPGVANRDSGAGTPRSVLLERCGWTHHHRYARHRGVPDAAAKQSITRVPLNHLSTEIVINSGCVDVKGEMSSEEKRAFLIEIDELRMWKVNASEELNAKNHEVETLKQCAAGHASKVELLKSEAAKREEAHRDQVSILKSQMTTIASNYADQQKCFDASNAEIRELEQVIERTKSTLLAKEMALSTKNQEIEEKNQEIEELKSELSLMMAAKGECQTDEGPVDDGTYEQINELSNQNMRLNTVVAELEAQLKSQLEQSERKSSDFLAEIDNLQATIKSTTEENDRLRKESEKTSLALAESHDKNSLLGDKCDGLLAEIESANRAALESAEQITSFRTEIDELSLLPTQIAQFKEQIKVLERENASISSRLESKSGCYKELMAQIVDQQDVLKLADQKIAEARDEKSELRIQLEESKALNDLMSKQMSEHKDKLKVARDIIAKVRSENASLEETLRCKAVEGVQSLRQRLEDTGAEDSDDASSEVTALRQWKLVAQETIDVTNKEMETLSSVNQELRMKQRELVEQLQSNEAECEHLHADNRKCAKEAEVSKLALADAVNKSSSLQISLTTKSSQYDKLQQELLVKVTEYESAITELKVNASEETAAHIDMITRLETDLASATSTINELMIKAENQATEITTLQNELHAAEKDLVDAVGDVDQLERFVSEVRENLLLKDKELNQTKAECERLSSEIKIYQDKCEIAEEDYISLRVRFQYHEQLSKQLDASKSECDALKAKVTELEHQLINEELAVTNYEISNLKKDNTKLASKVKSLEYDVIEYEDASLRWKRELLESKNLCEELKLTIKSSTGEEPLSLQGIITSLREEVERLTTELQETTTALNDRNQSLESDVTDKTNEISKLTAEISSLKDNILDLQDFVAAERGPRLDALRQLETDLREKEKEIARQLAESKNASNGAIQAEAKYVSLKLLNEAITSERDDLMEWKQEAEHRLKVLGSQVEELTLQSTALQLQCNEQKSTIKEKEDLIKDLEHSVKSKKFAVARYEEDMILTSKEIAILKSKCNELEALTNVSCDDDRVAELEEWKQGAESTLESNREHIECLLSEKENLESKIKKLVLQEQSLSSQLSTIHDEKIALAKSSLDMAEAYEEKIKSLQDDADRLNELTAELEKQRGKYEDAQMAIKSMEMALVAVEKQRKKLQRESPCSL